MALDVLCPHVSKESEVRFIRTKEVLAMIGVSRSTLWRMVRAGSFPRRISISARAAGHIYEDVQAWMAARASTGESDHGPTDSRKRGSTRSIASLSESARRHKPGTSDDRIALPNRRK